jgi:tetratricopeptide (TPR) repeat protein
MIRIPQDDPDGLVKTGYEHHRAGRVVQAEQTYRRALEIEPKHPKALHFLGLLAYQAGKLPLALAILKDALEAAPSDPQILTTVASAFHAAGENLQALDCLKQAERLAPNFHPAKLGLGLVYKALGKIDQAERAFEAVLAREPNQPDALLNLGGLRFEQGLSQEALDLFQRALAARPTFALAAFNLAQVHEKLEDWSAAGEAYRQAIKLDPQLAGAYQNLGTLLREQNRFEEAADCYRRVIALRPKYAPAHLLLGNVLAMAGQVEPAIAALDDAIALDPRIGEAFSSRSHLLLLRGDFDRGLADLEHRSKGKEDDPSWRKYSKPNWDGQACAGSLLIWPEQGVGDHLLAAGLFPLVRERIDIAAAEVDRRLVPMLMRARPDIPFITAGQADEIPFTHQVPLASLPRCLAPWPKGFVPVGRYIEPDPKRIDDARGWLATLGPGPKIGLSWRTPKGLVGLRKSLPLAEWGPILKDRKAQFIDLQYGDTYEDVAAAREQLGVEVKAMPGLDRFNDLEGLAALIDALDLTITTSNVTAHVVGALGRKGLVLLQQVPIWYWTENQDVGSTLFYPTLKTYRQPSPGAWDPVVKQVASELDVWLASR